MIDMINIGMDIGLLGMLLACALLILRSGSLLAITLLSTAYSLSICALFVILDAVDVAFTEAAVGAGISTVLLLAVIRRQDESLHAPRWPSAISIVIGLGLGILLIIGTLDMPMYGNPQAPVHLRLAPRFIGQSGMETGIPNVVTSVLASYRGYDTLGEVVVIFAAGLAVLLLLPSASTDTDEKPEDRQRRTWLVTNPILKTTLLRVIPLVLLFALYVQFHGDYGPGGGFQAGVIFGAGVITCGLLCGLGKLLTILSERWVSIGMAAGVLLYAGTGVAAMWLNGNFLDYSTLAETPTAGQHIGILLIEFGVGITVAFTMISLFICFSRGRN